VDLVAVELEDRHTSGFGALPIHDLLLKDQLEALQSACPNTVSSNERFEPHLTTASCAPPRRGLESASRSRAQALLRPLWARA
jgi:hypothetical protein